MNKLKSLSVKKRFRVLPGAQIGFGFDYTGMILEQFGDNWLIDKIGQIVLKQPEKDINGKRCAVGGSVAFDPEHLIEV